MAAIFSRFVDNIKQHIDYMSAIKTRINFVYNVLDDNNRIQKVNLEEMTKLMLLDSVLQETK